MKFYLVIVLSLMGCSSPSFAPSEKEHVFELVLKDEILLKGKHRSGLHELVVKEKGGKKYVVHRITLLRNEYPRCLQHEVRHILEGNFHEGRDSYEDCFD